MPIPAPGVQPINSEEIKKKNIQTFVDREDTIKVFSDELDELRKNINCYSLIYYWGIGGIGKSHLITHFLRDTSSSEPSTQLIDKHPILLLDDQLRVSYNLDISL